MCSLNLSKQLVADLLILKSVSHYVSVFYIMIPFSDTDTDYVSVPFMCVSACACVSMSVLLFVLHIQTAKFTKLFPHAIWSLEYQPMFADHTLQHSMQPMFQQSTIQCSSQFHTRFKCSQSFRKSHKI